MGPRPGSVKRCKGTLARWISRRSNGSPTSSSAWAPTCSPARSWRSAASPARRRSTRALARARPTATARSSSTSSYFDLHVKKARIELSREEDLDYVPPWYGQRAAGARRAARRAHRRSAGRWSRRCSRAWIRRAWAATSCRSSRSRWRSSTRARSTGRSRRARRRSGRSSSTATSSRRGAGRLEEQLIHIMRLDEADPGRRLAARASTDDPRRRRRAQRAALRRDPPARRGHRPDRRAAAVVAVDGRRDGHGRRDHAHRQRAHRGGLHGARPAARRRHRARDQAARAAAGRRSRGCACASRAAARSRSRPTPAARSLRGDDRAATRARARLGELALVDREGRIGPLDTVFYDTLLDENAASHIALGAAYELSVGRRRRQGAHQPLRHPHRLHDRLAGDGGRRPRPRDGAAVPVLRDGVWQI